MHAGSNTQYVPTDPCMCAHRLSPHAQTRVSIQTPHTHMCTNFIHTCAHRIPTTHGHTCVHTHVESPATHIHGHTYEHMGTLATVLSCCQPYHFSHCVYVFVSVQFSLVSSFLLSGIPSHVLVVCFSWILLNLFSMSKTACSPLETIS